MTREGCGQDSYLVGKRILAGPESGQDEVEGHIAEEVLATCRYPGCVHSFDLADERSKGAASSNAHLQRKDVHENENKPRRDVLLADPRRYFV